ncbi:UNVERIFIED_CONTAM: 30S ribosomal protein S31, chloroplastic [Sesamum radiatum]|uniref:30S ribosomal protein S31, chloroplastic n=1 Tax=Sesamum radiatum TaxID=300843 RepID=A0AAW2TE96_SESRA
MASLLLGVGAPPPMASQSSLHPSISFSKSLIHTPPLSASATSLSASASASTPTLPLIYCGRGDKKTARGKRFNHSFGNARPKDKKKGRGPPRVPAPPLPPRKDKYDDGEVVKIEIDESLFSK